jgi:hypothetical protein
VVSTELEQSAMNASMDSQVTFPEISYRLSPRNLTKGRRRFMYLGTENEINHEKEVLTRKKRRKVNLSTCRRKNLGQIK